MNIVFSICGIGKRFRDVGYEIPKFLIEYCGKPMIQHSVDTLGVDGKIHFIIREDDMMNYPHIEKLLLEFGDEIILCKGNTRGAAESLLLSENYIKDKSLPFMSVNCDQYMEWDGGQYMKILRDNPNSCIVPCFESDSPKCSFAKTNDSGEIVEIREKKVISNLATVGIYHWSKSEDFFTDAKQMIEDGVMDNNEFYVAPVYNYTIKRGVKVLPYLINKSEYHMIGTPEDMDSFLKYKNCN